MKKEIEKLFNLFKKKKKCALCLEKIPLNDEWSEWQFLSESLARPIYFHKFCWERYNEKVKWNMKTDKLWEAQELAGLKR